MTLQSPSPNRNEETAVLGLDIGGTKTAAGIVLFPSGVLLNQRIIPTTPTRPGDQILGDIRALASELKDAAASLGHPITGIGAGVAELVSPNGEVTSSQTIPWKGMPVRESLSKIAPAVVESDVRAAAIGETLLGAGKDFGCFVYVTVGTGISSCLVQDGRPHVGAHGNAIVLATAPLSSTCPNCGVYSSPVLEEFASGPALARRFSEASGQTVLSGEEVTERAEREDARAIEVVRSAGRALGVSVAFLANVLDPEAIIVGGGLGLDGRLYWRSMDESTRSHIWADAGKSVPIIPAKLGKEAGVIGAAAAFWKTHKERSKGEARSHAC
jgi:glucokinase